VRVGVGVADGAMGVEVGVGVTVAVGLMTCLNVVALERLEAPESPAEL
jgi:hypothetical protein